MICATLALYAALIAVSSAQTLSISLSQEQDGGDAGRACIYVHQGKAEFRVVKPGESCAAQITVETHRS
ncbi:hypothetical protein WB66_16435 [bacteria symbiont BFo1 of Frankliniella occidentalis]|nr:hypothetical protein WB66_16435 [bacteria symbiont BFo1 of Frankliniella occidentalis]KYP89601.1 hypothetical protein WB91_15270 [bacteria symbiont BFo1 of Frankliniella occidentalis]